MLLNDRVQKQVQQIPRTEMNASFVSEGAAPEQMRNQKLQQELR